MKKKQVAVRKKAAYIFLCTKMLVLATFKDNKKKKNNKYMYVVFCFVI